MCLCVWLCLCSGPFTPCFFPLCLLRFFLAQGSGLLGLGAPAAAAPCERSHAAEGEKELRRGEALGA